MARDRMIRKKFWDDRKLSKISRDARLLFIGLWNLADDLGILVCDHLFIKSKVFPYDQIQLQQFGSWLNELLAHGFISQFSHKKEDFYYLPNFSKHQTINRPNYKDLLISKEELKTIFTEHSVNDHGISNDDSLPKREIEEENKREEKDKGESPSGNDNLETENENLTPPSSAPPPSFTGPPIEDVIRWFRGAGGTEEMAHKFWNSYDAVGWIHKGTKIVRWASLAGNFIRNYRENEERDERKATTTGNKPPPSGTSGGNKGAFTGKSGGFAILADRLRNNLQQFSPGGTAGTSDEV
ncbi:hypothetical protein [Chitinophaga varians]|uniref:hypothetical protein n=1 Tax=Chitinophaga varians TaxID=2202339 RepID=UPI00165FE7FF|nr:hypothetical protein [Chitinophaga varians]MBC9913150.1 hypothetical protein [Chitinophaga varians]